MEKRFDAIRQFIYWQYANLAMAHAALKEKHINYEKIDYMIRAKLYKGFCCGTHHIASIYDDEKLKLKDKLCCYCGTTEGLSLDHLIPRYAGGSDSADNIVYACKRCNSSKGKKDLIVWYLEKEQFPPILILRRYLKLAYIYFETNDYLDKPYAEIGNYSPMFRLDLLPNDYPPPSKLRL